MIERVAIVGSRGYVGLAAVRAVVAGLAADAVVVSGGAAGVDSVAYHAAKERGLATAIHFADWEKHGKAAGPIRNSVVVADCDRVIAFWDGKSRGTMDTVRKARAAGKPVEVIR